MPKVRIRLLGDNRTGKTSLAMRFADNVFGECSGTTMGVDFKTRSLVLGGETVACEVWDSEQQPKRLHGEGTHIGRYAYLLVCDLTHRKSFENIKTWVENRLPKEGPIFLVGTKSDLENEIAVRVDELDALAKTIPNCTSLGSVSSKDATNVDKVFTQIAEYVTGLTKEKEPQDIKSKMPNIERQLDEYTELCSNLVYGKIN